MDTLITDGFVTVTEFAAALGVPVVDQGRLAAVVELLASGRLLAGCPGSGVPRGRSGS
jgi:hypothetical protein